ncbi:MAG: hypothetical protein WC708_04310 [Lentisphaeria bacterium]
MKRWAWLVAALYAAMLIVLTVPAVWGAFYPRETAVQAARILAAGGYWCWVALMMVGELLLLRVPVLIAEKRLKSRRPLLVPVITSALLLALLFAAAGLAVWCGLWGDKGPAFLKQTPLPDTLVLFDVIGLTVALWLAWGLLFWRFAKSAGTPEALLARLTRWLVGGSIVEFLVAVPCHIATRQREDCCAPVGTFFGLAFGISVMLMAFGPGVFFLFVARWRRLHPTARAE